MLLANELPGWYVRGFAFVLGAVWGSFANVVIYRWPREMSVAHPPSHCFACKTPIKPYDNVPVFAYLWLRGKCRTCGARFSPRYALIELMFGLVAAAIAERLFAGASGAVLPAWAAAAHWVVRFSVAFGLMVTAFIDLDEMLVPDFLAAFAVAPLAAAALLPAAAPTPGIVGAVAGAVLGPLVLWILFIGGYKKLTGKAGMGQGDAVMLLVVGALLGLPGVMFSMGAGAVQGLLATGIAYLFNVRIGPSNADEVEDEDEDEGGEDGEEGEEGGAQSADAPTESRASGEESEGGSREKSEEASGEKSVRAEASAKGEGEGEAGGEERAAPAASAEGEARTEPSAPAATEGAGAKGEGADEGEADAEQDGKGKRRLPLKIPFGPFLALAALEYLLGFDELVNSYLRAFSGE